MQFNVKKLKEKISAIVFFSYPTSLMKNLELQHQILLDRMSQIKKEPEIIFSIVRRGLIFLEESDNYFDKG